MQNAETTGAFTAKDVLVSVNASEGTLSNVDPSEHNLPGLTLSRCLEAKLLGDASSVADVCKRGPISLLKLNRFRSSIEWTL